jgi:hypothetical protein
VEILAGADGEVFMTASSMQVRASTSFVASEVQLAAQCASEDQKTNARGQQSEKARHNVTNTSHQISPCQQMPK